ncbi:MAG: hypothetical protein AAGC44_03350 [Planctomycetota bacterium]
MQGLTHTPANPWRTWYDAAQRETIDHAIRTLYAELDAAIAEHPPVCNASGRCCRFDEYGHRLYVTGLEIAWFLSGVHGREMVRLDGSQDVAQRGFPLRQFDLNPQPRFQTPHCPYQVKGLCRTHTIRPLGCRVFFCERGTEAWQQETTERFLDRLKQMHVEQNLPYAYMEWRAGLAEASRELGDLL